jgi:hypothetical protein
MTPPSAAPASLVVTIITIVSETAWTAFLARKRRGRRRSSGSERLLLRLGLARDGRLGVEWQSGSLALGPRLTALVGGRSHSRSGRLPGRLAARRGSKYFAALLLHLLNFALYGGDDVVVIFEIFEEVADVKEGVAIEADIDEGRLHARQHARNTAFVNAAD